MSSRRQVSRGGSIDQPVSARPDMSGGLLRPRFAGVDAPMERGSAQSHA